MKRAWIACLLAASVGVATLGCASADDDRPAQGPAEAEVKAATFVGVYAREPNPEIDDVAAVSIAQKGNKLVIEVDLYGEKTEYDLSRTPSGAYVFTTGEIDGECDDPGCTYVSKIAGVVYMKDIAGKQKPVVKLTVTEANPYPEEEDAEPYYNRVVRFQKDKYVES